MANSRFESYVRDTLADATKARRDELAEAYKAEVAKVEAKAEALEEIATEGIKALNAKIDAAARKLGWHVQEGSDPAVGQRCHIDYRFVEARTEYDCLHGITYKNGPAKEAKDALDAFDAAVKKAARRLVVCKMDLHMKPDAFDKMMADAVAKLLK